MALWCDYRQGTTITELDVRDFGVSTVSVEGVVFWLQWTKWKICINRFQTTTKDGWLLSEMLHTQTSRYAERDRERTTFRSAWMHDNDRKAGVS